MRYGFGVDIFGTEIKMGFFSESGELIEKWKIVTPLMQDGNRILPAIADDIERYMKEHHLYEDQIIGVGVGIPGPVNGSGVVNKCVLTRATKWFWTALTERVISDAHARRL